MPHKLKRASHAQRSMVSGIPNAVKGVSIDIEPGLFVIIVGKNGSRKSSLTRIGELSSGDIHIDDRSINEYDNNKNRNSMAVLSQDELFPLRDDKLFGLTEGGWEHGSMQSKGFLDDLVHPAAVLGSAQTVMRDAGWNTILNPGGAIRQSPEGAGNGKVGKGAFNKLRVPETSYWTGEEDRSCVDQKLARW